MIEYINGNGDYITTCPDCNRHQLFVNGKTGFKFCHTCDADTEFDANLYRTFNYEWGERDERS